MFQPTAKESFAPRLKPLPALLISLLFGAILVFLDVITGPYVNLAIFKTVVLMVAAATRSRKFLWLMAAALIVTTYSVMFIDLREISEEVRRQAVIINRSFNALTLLLVAGVLHAWIRADQESRETGQALEAQNRELAAREEQITRQNEELQSQTEELERQSEELRSANEHMVQRERMLETLLELSRSLYLGLGEDEAMERICQTLGQLINGEGSAAAILMQRGEHMHVRCHYGFGPRGVKQEQIDVQRSFATLIFEQRRSGYLEDLALRPELQVPQPLQGEPVMSVLATPLMVRGRPIGVLEVYSRHRRVWSEGHVAVVESLAAQASVSLENAALFDEVDQGRRRLSTILDSVPIGLAVADPLMSQVRFNAAGAALLGVPPDTNVADVFVRMAWMIYQDGKPLAREFYPLVRASRGERVFPHELEVVLASGRRLGILSSAAPFHDAAGAIIGAVSSFVDITQLKQLQRELETRRREAEEASVRKTRFLAAASHDIRTPANAISLLAELLKRTADSPSMAAEIPQLAEELRSSATALVNLVSNVLDVTRFDTDKLELHETEFPLARLLEEEARQVLPLAHAKKLILDVDPAPKHLWLRADRIKLGRVLGNLLGNAIKFTDQGGIRVVTTLCEDDGICIAVSDTGIGISPEHQTHIFDEFWQLSDANRSKGSGLGLSISKRLVDAMGGTLSVSSAIGKGSTFTVALPREVVLTRVTGEMSGAAST